MKNKTNDNILYNCNSQSIHRGYVTLALILLIIFTLGIIEVSAKEGSYMVCVYGLPKENLPELQKAGVNTLIIKRKEIEASKMVNLRIIYDLGVTPKRIRTDMAGINEYIIYLKNVIRSELYYLGDDLKCKHNDVIMDIKRKLGIRKGIVGVIKGVNCYDSDDLFIYHYPLMRRSLSLEKMLKKQVDAVTKVHARGHNLYLHVQAHPQFWYRELIERGNVNKNAVLYPDGQVARMLIYYATATGADGYSLFHHKSLVGKEAEERILGVAQALLETRPLHSTISKARKVDFFQVNNGIYGTKISGALVDIYFLFCGDVRTLYHPTIETIKMDIRSVPGMTDYPFLYEYSLGKLKTIKNNIDIPQDCARILLGVKNISNGCNIGLGPIDMDYYEEILNRRALVLSSNLSRMGLTIQNMNATPDKNDDKIKYLINYIDKLNETKRMAWLQRSDNLPTDGELLNTLYFKGLLKYSIKEPFNYYFQP